MGELEINHSVHVKNISVPNVTIVESETSTIVSVVPPTVQKEAEAATAVAAVAPVEGATAAEPEVIAKGKKPEEGAEEKPAAQKPAAPKK